MRLVARRPRLPTVLSLTREMPARVWQALRLGLVSACAAGLIGLHIRLLWLRFAEGSLWSPMVAARWVAAVVLCVTLLLLRRAGIPLFWGRKALVFWVLVLVLHATSGVAALDADVLQTLPVAATTALCTLLLLLRLPPPSASAAWRPGRTLVRRVVARRRRAWLRLHVPRPPPLALAR